MSRLTHAALLAVVAAVGAAALLGMALLWPDERPGPAPAPFEAGELFDATLIEVNDLGAVTDIPLAPGETTVEVTARLDGSGETVRFQTSDVTGDTYAAGQKVRLATIPQEGAEPTYYITDFRRSGALTALVALFVTAVIAFGRLQGARALLGLVATFAVIVGFIVPAILDGRNPLTVAVVGSLVIMIATLYLSHGFARKTTAAVVGTTLALLATGLLAVLFVEAANLTGFTSEEARLANVEVGGLSLRGLLLAGIVIGALGVLDDVTMSQASLVFELYRADRSAGFGRLLSGALTVGRDHIAATVNTLFLAYAGASLPLLILFATGIDPFSTVVTSEVVAVEVVRTLVGSIGLIAAVPLTTALAAAMVLAEPEASARETVAPGHSHADAPAPAPRPRASAGQPRGGPAAAEDPEEAGWERRLREAYRLPPTKD